MAISMLANQDLTPMLVQQAFVIVYLFFIRNTYKRDVRLKSGKNYGKIMAKIQEMQASRGSEVNLRKLFLPENI